MLASSGGQAHDLFQVRGHQAVLAGAVTQPSTIEQLRLLARGQGSGGSGAANQSAQLGSSLAVIARVLVLST